MRTGLGNRKHLRVLGGRDEHEQTSTTWEASQTNTIKMPVPPHTCMNITRMEGVYGTPALHHRGSQLPCVPETSRIGLMKTSRKGCIHMK